MVIYAIQRFALFKADFAVLQAATDTTISVLIWAMGGFVNHTKCEQGRAKYAERSIKCVRGMLSADRL